MPEEEEQPRVRECIEYAERVGSKTVVWQGNLWPVTIEWLEAEGRTATPCNDTYIITWGKD
jgi:hypothetical protein